MAYTFVDIIGQGFSIIGGIIAALGTGGGTAALLILLLIVAVILWSWFAGILSPR